MAENNNFYGAYTAYIEYFRSTCSHVPPPSYHEWCEVYLHGETSIQLDINYRYSSSIFSSATLINENSIIDTASETSENNDESAALNNFIKRRLNCFLLRLYFALEAMWLA